MLSLAEICRHYETEQEKILPFYTTAVDSDPELVLAQQVERNAEFPEDLRQVRALNTRNFMCDCASVQLNRVRRYSLLQAA